MKKQLYFEAGAQDVWFCEEDGKMSFFAGVDPDRQVERSLKCLAFPAGI